MTAALQMGQALVNKTNMVCALMKLSLVKETSIEQIITIVPRMSKERYRAEPVWRAKASCRTCQKLPLKDKLEMVGRESISRE